VRKRLKFIFFDKTFVSNFDLLDELVRIIQILVRPEVFCIFYPRTRRNRSRRRNACRNGFRDSVCANPNSYTHH
jgi:hypothetical protein